MAFDASSVLLAIRVGTLLLRRGQQIYIDHVRMNALILPLPEAVSTGIAADQVQLWLRADADGVAIAKADPELAALADRELPEWDLPKNRAARDRAFARFQQIAFITSPQAQIGDAKGAPLLPGISSDPVLAAKAAEHLFSLRQWHDEDPNKPPSTERAVAAAVIEAAITWFSNDPRLLANTRPEGKALQSFLSAVGKLDFARLPPGALLAGLLSGVLDTVAAEPRLLVGGRKETALVGAVSTALATSLRAVTDDPATDFRDKAALPALAHRLIATTLRAATDTVLAMPSDFLSTLDDSESAVVQSVGRIITDLAIDKQGAKVSLQPLLSGAGLEQIARGLFAAVAANPALIKVDAAKQPLKDIVIDLAATFATKDVPQNWRDALPAIAAPLLEVAARHLDGIWKVDGWDQLLTGAVRTTLLELAKEATAGKPLSAATLASVAQEVIAAVAANPAWATALPGNLAPIAPLVRDVLVALSKQRITKLNEGDVVAIVRQALVAGGERLALVGDGSQAAGTGPTAQVIGAVFDGLSNALADQQGSAEAAWRVASRELVSAAIQAALRAVAAKGGPLLTPAELATIVSTVRGFATGAVQPEALAATLLAALSN
ncbi:MAG: hypothetical protein IT556_11125 [Acetobacteraceae bacterium]|nr:hypothetical protein [Acetobacteraceae bacterium]